MTGYGTVASHLGLPDASLATYRDMVDRVASFCDQATTPLICDADTGYGGLLNVAHTVRGYEQAGAAAIQLEDQEFPKKCRHTPGRRVIPAEDMAHKIAVAAETRHSPEFLIIARTDARTSLGLDEALRRGELYEDAGADIIFIESPETEAEMATVARRFDVPALINIVEGGRTPYFLPNSSKTWVSRSPSTLPRDSSPPPMRFGPRMDICECPMTQNWPTRRATTSWNSAVSWGSKPFGSSMIATPSSPYRARPHSLTMSREESAGGDELRLELVAVAFIQTQSRCDGQASLE